jgi:hypothetical protein
MYVEEELTGRNVGDRLLREYCLNVIYELLKTASLATAFDASAPPITILAPYEKMWYV